MKLAGAALVALALATGCGASGKSGAAPSGQLLTGGALTERLALSDIDTMNPLTGSTYAATQFDLAVYDRLLSLGPTGAPVPYLATSWTTSGNAVVLRIRKGATCSDGTQLTASAVAASLKYDESPATGAFPTPLIFGPAGASIVGDDANSTVTITTKQAYADLLAGLANPAASIICPAGLKDPSALKTKAFGSGPYTLSQSVPGDHYTLRARAGYNWGPGGRTSSEPGMPATIVLKLVPNETTVANLLTTNGIGLGVVQGQDVRRLLANKAIAHTPVELAGADGLLLNESAAHPGADPAVRRAVMLAVDGKQYSTAATFGQAAPSSTLFTAGSRCYNASDGASNVGYDPAAARSALEADGYTLDSAGKFAKDGHELSINIIGAESQRSGPEYLQNALQSIGVSSHISTTNTDTFVNDTFATGSWDLEVYPFGGSFSSPYFVGVQVSGPTPPNGVNVAFIKNKAYDTLQTQALTQSQTESCASWNAAERAILSNADAKALETAHFDWFSNKVTYSVYLGEGPDPFSIRMYK